MAHSGEFTTGASAAQGARTLIRISGQFWQEEFDELSEESDDEFFEQPVVMDHSGVSLGLLASQAKTAKTCP